MVLLHEQKLSYDTGHAQALQGHEHSDVGRCATVSMGAVSSNNLIIVAGHSPHKETVLVLRIDDPEFFDCCFQC